MTTDYKLKKRSIMMSGRPRKYFKTTIISISIPEEIKNTLDEVAKMKNMSRSELVTTILDRYLRSINVKLDEYLYNNEINKRERCVDIVREFEVKRVEKELEVIAREVGLIEKAIISGNMLRLGGRTLVPPEYLLNKKLNQLFGLEKKLLSLERNGISLPEKMRKVIGLIEKLEKLKEYRKKLSHTS